MLIYILLIIVAVPVLATILFMRQASFGRRPSGGRLARIKRSPQYSGGSFRNESETASLTGGAGMLTVMRDFFFGKHEHKRPVASVPAVKRDLRGPVPPGAPVVTWFGHSSYLLQVAGLNILVDPVFSERTSPVQYAGTRAFAGSNIYTASDMPDIDVLVITHDHYDHLDYLTVQQLKGRTGLFITSLGVGAHLEHWGVAPDRIRELDWWEATEGPRGASFRAAPSRHFSGRGFKRNQTLWSSFILDAGGHRIYLGGDSGYDQHFAKIGREYGPFDLVVLENGQYNVYWAHIHMMPEETVQAALDLRAKTLFPVHWGKFALATHPWNESIQRVLQKAGDADLRIVSPKIGEQMVLSEAPARPTSWWL